jgi:hypothetical protein
VGSKLASTDVQGDVGKFHSFKDIFHSSKGELIAVAERFLWAICSCGQLATTTEVCCN